MKATFVLTNAVPQRRGLNRGLWKELEEAVHALAAKRGTTWVISGPAFVEGKPVKTIGPHKVAVPTHTYKVVLCVHPNGDKEMFGFLMPNVEKPAGKIGNYSFTVSQVEKVTGLDFFSALPASEQRKLESAANALPAH